MCAAQSSRNCSRDQANNTRVSAFARTILANREHAAPCWHVFDGRSHGLLLPKSYRFWSASQAKSAPARPSRNISATSRPTGTRISDGYGQLTIRSAGSVLCEGTRRPVPLDRDLRLGDAVRPNHRVTARVTKQTTQESDESTITALNIYRNKNPEIRDSDGSNPGLTLVASVAPRRIEFLPGSRHGATYVHALEKTFLGHGPAFGPQAAYTVQPW